MNQIIIRMATLDDADSILKIYEPYIMNTVITFEYEKVSLVKFQERMTNVMSQFPWLVCCIDGVLAGYAYCSPHFERAAFAWDCECSVYIDEEYKRRGIASALYDALFHLIKKQGYYNIYSLICVPNEGSLSLHTKHGFTEIGTFHNTAYKLGQWRHLLIMEKQMQSFIAAPDPIIPIHELDKNMLKEEFEKAKLLVKA